MNCILCNKALADGDFVTLREKGSNGINKASEERESDIRVRPGQQVHKNCRATWINPHYIANVKRKTVQIKKPKTLRSESGKFDFEKNCLFCGFPAKFDGKKREYDVTPVRTDTFARTIKNVCDTRNDKWSCVVSGRLAFVNDLHAADAIYHNQCSINFRTGKGVPHLFSEDKQTKALKGRPCDEESSEAFTKITKYLEENDEEQISVKDLQNKMKEILTSGQQTNQEPYSTQYMKTKLKDHFGDKIIFTNLAGKNNIVTFRTTASVVLQEHYNQPRSFDDETEKLRLISTAAKLLKNDIKTLNVSEEYPGAEEMNLSNCLAFLPNSLKCLLDILVTGKKSDKKKASIGQAVVQAARPHVMIAPLQIGLAVEMHHQFGSRFLVDSLHQHGFCSSYADVQRFEKRAAATKVEAKVTNKEQFVQYVGDNVDHNIRTLDGHGTFHGMGMVAVVSPGQTLPRKVKKQDVQNDLLTETDKVQIHQYIFPRSNNTATFDDINAATNDTGNPPELDLDILWKVAPFFEWPRPGWSGFMQMIHQKKEGYIEKSAVTFLPMIDLDPTDMTCIYSTLLFLCRQAQENNITPVITFDQPLWWKAYSIIHNEPFESPLKSVVLRLGGLHTEMSFLGCIGHLMDQSGLSDTLEIIYGSNAVKHMLTGKAIARATRGHFLVDSALNIILLEQVVQTPSPRKFLQAAEEEDNEEDTEDNGKDEQDNRQDEEGGGNDKESEELHQPSTLTSEAQNVYNKLVNGSQISAFDLEITTTISDKLEELKEKLRTSRTGLLWLQYMQMVDILKKFITAERTGNWNLHLQSVKEMLPYFAAAGHNLYTRTAYIYLQEMCSLPEKHPSVYMAFQKGHHSVRRSNRYWGGLSTDLIIEQMLMRSIKSSGGLTRGRGMTESQRNVWVNSMPACIDIKHAMQNFTGLQYQTSEQHKEASSSRKERDCKDTEKLVAFIKARNPFSLDDLTLRNYVSGVVATDMVDAEKSKSVGDKILASMKGHDIYKLTLKRDQQAKTIGSSKALKAKPDTERIDPELLFQRLALVNTQKQMDMEELFKYELCDHPIALFELPNILRAATKAVLADVLWKEAEQSVRGSSAPCTQHVYVLDGGALLHRLAWKSDTSFQTICDEYIQYVTRKYGRCAIVFDGYLQGPSIKDIAHMRRASGTATSVTIHFSPSTLLTVSKSSFLANKENKQHFITLLGNNLEKAGCDVTHAKGDADLLIVQTAIAAARSKEVTVVADDTDILVLLCHHADATKSAKDIWLQPEPKRHAKKVRCWNIAQTQEALGKKLCRNLLFVHAIQGCDTTSQPYGVGKGAGITKKLYEKKLLRCLYAKVVK